MAENSGWSSGGATGLMRQTSTRLYIDLQQVLFTSAVERGT